MENNESLMNFQYDNNGLGGLLFAAGAVVFGVAVSLFWMVVAWRAMRAHERLADATEDLANPDSNARSDET
jgi:uncharacterized membrane protein